MPPAPPFAARPWTRIGDDALSACAGVPTMLSPAERRFYLWLARDWATGAGAIVDLGCFVGGSTAHLAEGQRQAGRAAPVHAYDRFRASPPVKRNLLYPAGIAPFEEDDVLPLARRLLAPWPEVRLHRGQIEDQTWDGGPIEILTLDASKTVEGMDRMARIFFPHLVPGRSVIVQQDFLHWRQPWIPVQMERLAGCFEPVAHAPPDTVAYLCTATPTPRDLDRAACGAVDDAALQAGLAAAQARFAPWGLAARIARQAAALRASPGVRQAKAMREAT